MSVPLSCFVVLLVIAQCCLVSSDNPNTCCVYVNPSDHTDHECLCVNSCPSNVPGYQFEGSKIGCNNCFYFCNSSVPSPSPPTPPSPSSPPPLPCHVNPFISSSVTGESLHAAVNDDGAHKVNGIAFSQGIYWVVYGGTRYGINEGKYDEDGNLLATYNTSNNFNSIVDLQSRVEVYAFVSNPVKLLEQIDPGVWSIGPPLLPAPYYDAGVYIDQFGGQWIWNRNGTIVRYVHEGYYSSVLPLLGFGEIAGENEYPQQYRMAWASPFIGNDHCISSTIAGCCGYYLTYTSGRLSAWNIQTGIRLGVVTLVGAPTDDASYTSFSYTNGHVFLYDGNSSGDWMKYQVF